MTQHDTTDFGDATGLTYYPTDFSPFPPGPEHDPQRVAGIAQSVLMTPGTLPGLWRLATELDAAFNRGQSLHVTIANSASTCWTFGPDNARHLLPVISSALIRTPDQASGVIVRTHDLNDTGAVIRTGICCLFAQDQTLQDGDVQGYLDAHGSLKAHERFITLSELFPGGGQAAQVITTQAQMPLDLLRTLYPHHQYPADAHPAQVTALDPADPARERGLRDGANLPEAARRSGAWDLARRLDTAFLAGRDITADIHVQGRSFTFTPDTAGAVYGTFAQLLQNHPAPAVLAVLSERQEETFLLHGAPSLLFRIALADTTDDHLRDHPYADIDPDGGLYPMHLITPVNTLLPPPNRPLHA